jgi:uncharacterized Zn-finger protein
VLLGSNETTLKQTLTRIEETEQLRAALISQLELTLVSEPRQLSALDALAHSACAECAESVSHWRDSIRRAAMAEHVVPHFHNDVRRRVSRSARRSSCASARTPPFDHPHVFCDMGDDNEFICSYCSTLYRYNPEAPADSRSAANAPGCGRGLMPF